MESRIGHVHVRFRVARGSAPAAAAIPALERIVRGRIAAACDRAFADVFGDDPAVYVVRGIEARVAMAANAAALESRTADQWGRRLCAAVVRTLAADDRDRVVTFEDPAAFVASFLSDFVAGVAWDRWFYGRFAPLRARRDDDVILTVLSDDRDALWHVLARLRRAGTLEEILRRLGPDGQRRLWSGVAGRDRDGDSPEALRIFVGAAVAAADALDLWIAAPPDGAALVEAYVKTLPAAPDWTSAASLADAVADVVHWLHARKLVDAARTPEDASARLHAAGAALDWLDAGRLAERLSTLRSTVQVSGIRKARVVRPPLPSAAQRRLLDLLYSIVAQGTTGLRAGDLAEANVLRLVAALVEHGDAPRAHGLALVEHIVEAWKAIASAAAPGAALSALRAGDLQTVLSCVSDRTAAVEEHLTFTMRAGEPAAKLVDALIGAGSADRIPGEWIETGAAGLFLLARAVQDTRLASLAVAHGLDSARPLLAALAIVLGGRAARPGDALDPGAAQWSGIDAEAALPELDRLERMDRAAFLGDLEDLLLAQRALDPGEVLTPLAPLEDEGVLPVSAACADFVRQVAALVLRAWGRWLPGLGRSSGPYLLAQFIRRGGAFVDGDRRIDVHLDAAPLDQVLRMAGYLSETPPVTWLGARTIRFHSGPRP